MTGSSPHLRLARLAVLAAVLSACGGGGSDPPASAPPALSLSSTTVAFTGRSFRAELPVETVTVTNGGAGTLAPPQLSVTHADGGDWLTVAVVGTSAPYTITLAPTAERLPAGVHTASVHVASPGASNGPQTISVTLTLTPTWSVFVYGHADGDRGTAFVRDLQEMSEASLGDAVTLVVAADLSAGRAMPDGGTFEAGTWWLRIPGSGQEAEPLTTVAEQDFDDPAVLGAAVASAFSAYPADHLAIVLWGRGASWRGFGGDENDTPGDPSDDGAGLTGAAIAGALAGALVEVGHPRPLAFVAFDASTMMGQEVAYELREVASVLIASAEVELGGGWDYATSLGRLGADPSISPLAFAAGEVQDWTAHHTGPADLLVRAHAALDLTRMAAYAAAWAELSSALAASIAADPLVLARALHATAPGYGAGDPADADPRTALRDAGQLLNALAALASEPVVAAAAENALTALDALVVARSLGDARVAAGQKGLHFEGTLGAAWLAAQPAYEQLGWHPPTRWGDLLGSFAGEQPVPPAVVIEPLNTADPNAQNPPLLRLHSSDADVADARLYLAVDTGANVLSRGLIAEVPVHPYEWAEGAWDGNLPSLSDGLATSAVFVRPWLRGASHAIFLLPGEISYGLFTMQAHAVVVGDASGGVPSSATVSAFAVGSSGSLAVLPLSDFGGLEFVPSLLDETTGGWTRAETTSLAIPSEPDAFLTFARTSAPAGTYWIRAAVADVWGNVNEKSTKVTVLAPFGM